MVLAIRFKLPVRNEYTLSRMDSGEPNLECLLPSAGIILAAQMRFSRQFSSAVFKGKTLITNTINTRTHLCLQLHPSASFLFSSPPFTAITKIIFGPRNHSMGEIPCWASGDGWCWWRGYLWQAEGCHRPTSRLTDVTRCGLLNLVQQQYHGHHHH